VFRPRRRSVCFCCASRATERSGHARTQPCRPHPAPLLPATQSSLYASTHIVRACIGLSLAAPRRASVRARTCSDTVSTRCTNSAGRKAPAGFTNRRYLLILHLYKRAGSPAAALGHRLLVRREVEGEEEEQVRRDNADASNGGELFTCALAHVGDVRPVGAGEVGERGEVDEACWWLVVARLEVPEDSYRDQGRIARFVQR
jgi:hypothetical protein